MAGETTLTIIGNLTADPELRFTQSGVAVANFTVAATPRTFDKNSNEWKDGETLFMRCNVWREAAENVAQSLTKGTRVIVSGRLGQRSYETKEGEKRTSIELEVDEIGPSLRYASAQVTKAQPGGRTPQQGGQQYGGQQGGQWGGQQPQGGQWGGQPQQQPQGGPWGPPQGQQPQQGGQWGAPPQQGGQGGQWGTGGEPPF